LPHIIVLPGEGVQNGLSTFCGKLRRYNGSQRSLIAVISQQILALGQRAPKAALLSPPKIVFIDGLRDKSCVFMSGRRRPQVSLHRE
jgi:hypothetical protein